MVEKQMVNTISRFSFIILFTFQGICSLSVYTTLVRKMVILRLWVYHRTTCDWETFAFHLAPPFCQVLVVQVLYADQFKRKLRRQWNERMWLHKNIISFVESNVTSTKNEKGAHLNILYSFLVISAIACGVAIMYTKWTSSIRWNVSQVC